MLEILKHIVNRATGAQKTIDEYYTDYLASQQEVKKYKDLYYNSKKAAEQLYEQQKEDSLTIANLRNALEQAQQKYTEAINGNIVDDDTYGEMQGRLDVAESKAALTDQLTHENERLKDKIADLQAKANAVNGKMGGLTRQLKRYKMRCEAYENKERQNKKV